VKTLLRIVNDKGLSYQALMFVCPGCLEMNPEASGIHLLAVNTTEKTPSWEYSGDVNFPTLQPSILTNNGLGEVCHSFLIDGVFQFLGDCTHSFANQNVPIPDLPDWIIGNNSPE
jgi:Family of unknown function (DUF6527)